MIYLASSLNIFCVLRIFERRAGKSVPAYFPRYLNIFFPEAANSFFTGVDTFFMYASFLFSVTL